MFASLLQRVDALPAPEKLKATRPYDTEHPPLVSPSVSGSEYSQTGDASESFTPPTSLGDSASVSSTSLKPEAAASTPASEATEPGRRSARARDSIPATYNVKVLAGTSIHAPKRYKKNPTDEDETRRRIISRDALVICLASANSSPTTVQKDSQILVSAEIDALDLNWSIKKLPKSRSQLDLGSYRAPKRGAKGKSPERRKSTRSAGEALGSLTSKLFSGKKKFDDGLNRAQRELKRLADTDEYAKIDTKPVVHEVWSNGKLVVTEPHHKKRKREEEEAKAKELEKAKAKALKEAESNAKDRYPETERYKSVNGKRRKIWLSKGLYAGQDSPKLNWFGDLSGKEYDDLLKIAPDKPVGLLPMPMWHGQRFLQVDRFVGDASALWKRTKLFDSFSSKCVCTSDGGCDVDCQNRIMLYECDDTNCGAGRGHCTNRAFFDLAERRKDGGKYRIGVEVIKTQDRGYGVRSNRCFEPHQIIVEYTGEIITEDECDRRMNEDYKDNECYYLMSFDQNMIIDATKGSIARFVNHSCKPNSRMVKWIVGGKPRMALFAGDNPIMTGDELTYDYNFDPFSAKNVQECRCGSENCRGVLGPKPKDPKPIKETIKDAVKGAVKAGKAVKRKAKELLIGDNESDAPTPKRKRIKEAKGAVKAVRTGKAASSGASWKRKAKDIFELENAKAVKRSFLNTRKAIPSKSAPFTPRNTAKASTLKSNGKTQIQLSSRNSSLTIVTSESPKSAKSASSPRTSARKNLVRGSKSGPFQLASETTIRIISAPGDIGGMTAATLTAPLDVLKTRLQSDFYQNQLLQTRLQKGISPHAHLSPFRSGLLHFRETFQILGSVYRVEGWRALFKGLGPNLVGVVPARSISFYVVGNGKRTFANQFNGGKENAWVVCAAAALAGLVTSTVTNPIWLIKTRLQLDKNVVERTGGTVERRYKNSWDCVRQVVRKEGVKGLYKGMTASYLGVTEHTLQWVLYEEMKKGMARREHRIVSEGREKRIWDRTVEWTGNIGAAGSAKLVAALITYPHEVARTRLRQAPLENGHPKYTGLMQCFKLVWKEEGMAAMYGGLTPHLLRTVPSAAIMFGMYEGILKLLHAPA
ncbi:hypothetical protein BJ878DRAFT_536504 [Calycina marina]|uniref:Uncharacterized protein n=1 Tax=Calycina marina TaxID=1763456 RepID=A0A9P7YWX7_9HELO|nr:hypothetical protein BJ878DRAFT_536504 [Calycina marina]